MRMNRFYHYDDRDRLIKHPHICIEFSLMTRNNEQETSALNGVDIVELFDCVIRETKKRNRKRRLSLLRQNGDECNEMIMKVEKNRINQTKLSDQ
jgi:hypothetical protein